MTNNYCPICGREVGGEMQYHHLLPKTFKTRTSSVHKQDNLIYIHKSCHQKIHATFSESELYHIYNNIDALVEHSEMKKFIKWIQRKPIEWYDKNDDTKSRRKKR